MGRPRHKVSNTLLTRRIALGVILLAGALVGGAQAALAAPLSMTMTARAGVLGSATQDAEARTLVESRCTACHSLGVIESASYRGDQWSAVVARMVTKGASLSDDEQDEVARYLDRRYGSATGDAFTGEVGVTLILTASGDSSAVDRMRLSNDGVYDETDDAEEWQGFSELKYWELATGDGAKSVHALLEDAVGATQDVTADVTLDTAAPTGTVSINRGAPFTRTTGVTLDLPVGDGAGSGVAKVRVSNDSWTWSPWDNYAAARPHSLTAGSGFKWVYVEYADAVGNTSDAVYDLIVFDDTPPALQQKQLIKRITRNRPTLEVPVSDALSGLDPASVKVLLNGKPRPFKKNRDGVYRYRVRRSLPRGQHCLKVAARDRAGNPLSTSWCFKATEIIKKHGRYYSSRKRAKPRVIVVHATAGNYPYDYKTLMGRTKRKVSVHIYIRKDGSTYRMVNDRLSAWHAGRSSWRGRSYRGSVNTFSLGIELENRNDGIDPYTLAQIEAAAEVSKYWMKKYKIPGRNVTTHAAIAPGRKSDPVAFPWDNFWRSMKS